MENNIKILLWLHKNKVNKRGTAPLMIRITYNNERFQLATGFLIDPERWDQVKGRVKGNKADAREINQYIEAAKVKLIQLYTEAVMNGDIYLNGIVSKFLGKGDNQITLLQGVEHHIKYIKTRIGAEYSKSTLRIYLLSQQRLKSFISSHYGKKDIRLKDLNLEFIQEFDLYLRTEYKNDHNTVVRQCKNLIRVVNIAIQKGWLDKSPFTGFKCNYREIDPVFLSQQELDLIQHKDFGIKRLETIRDLFIFQCYTGLAFADMAKLKMEDISYGIDGGKWIFLRRQKTDKRSSIPLLPQSLKVIEKYRDDPRRGDRLLPVLSNQKYNSYLHEIAGVCGINKPLTSHIGRRTFATTIALANGVPIEVINKILGHSNIRMTQIYAIVTDLKISTEINRLRDVL